MWQICTTDLIGAEAHRPAAVNSPTLNSWGRIGKVTSRGGSEYNHRPRHQLTVWQSNATRTCTVKGLPGKWRPLVFVAYQKAGLLGQVAWLGESRKAKPCGCSLTRSLAPFPQPRSTSRWRRRRGPPASGGAQDKRLAVIAKGLLSRLAHKRRHKIIFQKIFFFKLTYKIRALCYRADNWPLTAKPFPAIVPF